MTVKTKIWIEGLDAPCPICGRKIRYYPWYIPFDTQKCAARFGAQAYERGFRIKNLKKFIEIFDPDDVR